ncbi:MAG TPA: histidine phosphatase family protein [Saprospiraceae bacterium]|nr:histidine phosphatase family protein [Saprospiraceae bacterium]HND88585.1 histidine phosphatase family protein [Saprospiraceae bacterium]HNG89960.1 histidine phosphatase family protein [Saprospiraceae bacterium]
MRLFAVMLLCSGAAFFLACADAQPAPVPLVLSIRDGQILAPGDSTYLIPHWGDSAYIILYCVRHADKVRDGSKDPGLTAEGQARAERLGRILAQVPLTRICTTPYRRTMLTGEAVQRRAGEPPFETYPPEAQDVWTDSVLASGGGKQYVVVGHQNTIPQLLNRLTGKLSYQNLGDYEYDRFFVVVTRGLGQTEVLECRY